MTEAIGLLFVVKLEVFEAAIDAEQAWLAAIAIANTVVSLYYYLRVIAPAVLDAAVEPEIPRRRAGAPLASALAVATVATVGFGLAADPLLRLADQARMLVG